MLFSKDIYCFQIHYYILNFYILPKNIDLFIARRRTLYHIIGFISISAYSLIIFPQAGPDVKYFLGFLRTQLSTTTTVVLVFGPKVLRVLRGQGDQWDHRSRVRGITASFSHNGIGLVPEDSPDLYQENEELKVRYFIVNESLIKYFVFVVIAGRNSKIGRSN